VPAGRVRRRQRRQPGGQRSRTCGTAKVYIDGAFVKEVQLSQKYPIEGYQKTVFRADGLTNTVVDAFDVHG
jgi:hypothetical protein